MFSLQKAVDKSEWRNVPVGKAINVVTSRVVERGVFVLDLI